MLFKATAHNAVPAYVVGNLHRNILDSLCTHAKDCKEGGGLQGEGCSRGAKGHHRARHQVRVRHLDIAHMLSGWVVVLVAKCCPPPHRY